jgi:hypothetical protein
MWEPRRLTTLWASTACYTDSFIIIIIIIIIIISFKFNFLEEPTSEAQTVSVANPLRVNPTFAVFPCFYSVT